MFQIKQGLAIYAVLTTGSTLTMVSGIHVYLHPYRSHPPKMLLRCKPDYFTLVLTHSVVPWLITVIPVFRYLLKYIFPDPSQKF
jgi:hypothetical protein